MYDSHIARGNGLATNSSRALSPNVYNFHEYKEQKSFQSVSIHDARKEQILLELYEVCKESIEAGRDTDKSSFQSAIAFIISLDLRIQSASVGIEADGKALLEWVSKEPTGNLTMFSLVFDQNDYVYSTMKNGVPGSCGALNYCEESRQMIEDLLKRTLQRKHASYSTGT